jgi:hypothetical protein
MKATVEIPDALFTAAKRLAAERGTTLRALVEAGLRHVVEASEASTDFRLRDATFVGNGLQRGFQDGSWERVREAAYEGRGG